MERRTFLGSLAAIGAFLLGRKTAAAPEHSDLKKLTDGCGADPMHTHEMIVLNGVELPALVDTNCVHQAVQSLRMTFRTAGPGNEARESAALLPDLIGRVQKVDLRTGDFWRYEREMFGVGNYHLVQYRGNFDLWATVNGEERLLKSYPKDANALLDPALIRHQP